MWDLFLDEIERVISDSVGLSEAIGIFGKGLLLTADVTPTGKGHCGRDILGWNW